MKSLAIVIPAYKITFFNETLKSLASQSNKDFTVYVGDDCSSNDFMSIIEQYKNDIDIIYHRFDMNLGGKDLVGQWARCIELTRNEPWIWLFSDDDIIGENCVDLFLKSEKESFDIFHFNVRIIDKENNILKKSQPFPEIISGRNFLIRKQCAKLDSFVVEYIFSRKIYEEQHGFQNFPMAWGSDIATWTKFASYKGIKTITGDFVYWRQSNVNITPQRDRLIVIRKMRIETDYYVWAKNFFHGSLNNYVKYFFIRSLVFYSPYLKYNDLNFAIKYAYRKKILNALEERLLLLSYPLIKIVKYSRDIKIKDIHNWL